MELIFALPVHPFPDLQVHSTGHFFNKPRYSWVPQQLGNGCHQPSAESYLELSIKPCSWSPFSLTWKSGEEVSVSWLYCLLWENQRNSLSLQYLSLHCNPFHLFKLNRKKSRLRKVNQVLILQSQRDSKTQCRKQPEARNGLQHLLFKTSGIVCRDPCK